MQLLQGTVQHYSWGTPNAIPEILGIEADGRPFAEYWLGAHPLSPSHLGELTLADSLAARPEALGEAGRAEFGDQLPYLVKILSARHALSLQAHPDRKHAEAGFARENEAGLELDSPIRTYRDPWPKPELLIALDEFHSLSGFRDPLETARLFAGLGVDRELASVIGPLTERKGPAAMAEVFLDVLSLDGERARLSELVCAAAMQHKDAPGDLGDFARTVIELDHTFPADPGILAALLLNRVLLRPGEAMYVPSGRMHAHLRGTGVEIMANSDNVVRGGLTDKHVDVHELIQVVDFSSAPPWLVDPDPVAPGIEAFPVPCAEFDAWRVMPAGLASGTELPGTGTGRILMLVSGNATLTSATAEISLDSGQAVFLPADAAAVTIRGEAVGFLVGSGIGEK